jgi:outer membrane biosynthesis protein TonB
LQTIGGKDWYRWGAEQLVANQKSDGNWEKGGIPGDNTVIDTCFALLFLSQANLAEDLANKLKMEAQLAANPPANQPKINPPPTAPTTPPPAPPVAAQPKPEPVQSKESEPPVEASVQPANQPAAASTAAAEEKSNVPLIAMFVAGGVLVAAGAVALLIVGLRKNASGDTDEDDLPRKRRPDRERNGDSRRADARPRARKGTRPSRE